MIRWKGVIFLVVLALIVLVLSLIFTDRWLENQLEKAGSSVVGARVEIDGLDFSLFGSHLKWQRLQVTDPKHTMRNLFETGVCELNFEFWPLLSKKIIVENFQISDLKTNTPRVYDGALPKKATESGSKPNVVQKSLQKIKQNIEQSTQLPLGQMKSQVNVDSLIQLLQLKAPQKIDSLQKALNQSFQLWSQRLSNTQYEKDLKEIETQIKSIDPQKIKKLKDLQKTLTTLKNVKKKIDRLADSLKTTKNALQTELARTRKTLTLVDDWIAQDYQQALARAKLPEISKKSIARMLFGSTLVNRFETYLGYVQTGRYYLAKFKSDKPKKEKPPRFKGQDIYFYTPNGRPDFWIKQIKLSGQTNDGLQLAGEVLDVISDQRFIQRPTRIAINSKSAGARTLVLNGKLNYLEPAPHETFELTYRGFSLNKTKLSDSPYLPTRVEKGTGSLQAKLEMIGDTVFSDIHFVAQNLQFETPSVAKMNLAQQLVFEAFQALNKLTVHARLRGTPGHWQLNINSNVDDVLTAQFKKRLSAEIVKAKERLRQEVEKKTAPARQKFESFVTQKQQWLESQLKKYENELQRLQKELDQRKKEINQRIEQEKKKASKDVQKKLKSLFK